MAKTLYDHELNPHHVSSLKEHHQAKHLEASFYTRAKEWLAVKLTNGMGTMECACVFAILAAYGFPGIHATPSQLVSWVSQTLIQLTALSFIMVYQKVISRVQDFVTNQIYTMVEHIKHSDEQVKKHLHAQDAELLEHRQILKAILDHNIVQLAQIHELKVAAAPTRPASRKKPPTATAS